MVREEIKKKINDFLYTMKALLEGKFIAVCTFIKKWKRFYASNLIAQLRAVEQKRSKHTQEEKIAGIVKHI